MRLIQDLVPIKNTCQVKEEAIAFSKLDHVREVAARPVYTIQAKKLELLRKKDENYEVPEVRCLA